MRVASVAIWDLPTRLFHWSLVLLVAASWGSAELGETSVHKWCGYAMLTLLGFRLIWGIVGSTHSRFARFLKGPRAVIEYWRGVDVTRVEGHNPAGGWAVVLMLLLLLTQALTGLFNEDDIAFSGPLHHTVSSKLAATLGAWHEINFNILLGLIALHIGAIVFHWRRGRNLLKPMLDGGISTQSAVQRPSWLALLILALCAALLYFLLSLVPAPQIFW